MKMLSWSRPLAVVAKCLVWQKMKRARHEWYDGLGLVILAINRDRLKVTDPIGSGSPLSNTTFLQPGPIGPTTPFLSPMVFANRMSSSPSTSKSLVNLFSSTCHRSSTIFILKKKKILFFLSHNPKGNGHVDFHPFKWFVRDGSDWSRFSPVGRPAGAWIKDDVDGLRDAEAPSYYCTLFFDANEKKEEKKRIGAGYLFVAPCLNLLPGVGEFIYNVFFGLLTANKWLSATRSFKRG